MPTQATVPSLSAGDMALMATPMLFGMPPMPPKLSKRAPIKKAQLPTNCEGKVRYVPPENWHPSEPLPRGPGGGYKDKFGNEWTKGPSRTKGQPFEWDVQRPDGSHWNVSLDGKVTH
ncbi:MAG: polymorphic toxin type 17 domain-containing protein [Thermodesulfobacteriota bacterium]